jgi:general secretion pathway protein N
MKLRRAYPLLATIAVLGAIAAYVRTENTTASSDDATTSGAAAPVRAPSPEAAVERPPGGNPLWALPLKQLSSTRERPIFSPSRRPPPPATPTFVAPVAVRAPQKPKEPERPSITLLGTILGSSESIGIFLNPTTRDIVRLRVGEDHEGWALRSVKTREVTLVKDRERVVLELPPPGDQAAAAAAANFEASRPPEAPRPSPAARRQQRR